MFELVFLGTAAAAPSADRGLPALLVTVGPRRFLIDCGEGTQRQLMRAGLGFRGLQHVLLTHAHLDHVMGLAGLIATLALFRVGRTIEIIGSDETIAFVRRYLADTIGPESGGAYRLRSVSPELVLMQSGWRLDAFPVAHRETESLGYIFQTATRHPLLAERLDALEVPHGPQRAALAQGRPAVLADGRRIVAGNGSRTADCRRQAAPSSAIRRRSAGLAEPVGGADALVIEATFLERDTALARSRGHLTAAAAGRLACDAGVGQLLLTHISGRYPPEEILAEAASQFQKTRVVADFDRVSIGGRPPPVARGRNRRPSRSIVTIIRGRAGPNTITCPGRGRGPGLPWGCRTAPEFVRAGSAYRCTGP